MFEDARPSNKPIGNLFRDKKDTGILDDCSYVAEGMKQGRRLGVGMA
jgi:hypothetical protein